MIGSKIQEMMCDYFFSKFLPKVNGLNFKYRSLKTD